MKAFVSVLALVLLIITIAFGLFSVVATVWMIFSAQKQNRQTGIPPFQISLQMLLIAVTLFALVGGMLAWGIRQ